MWHVADAAPESLLSVSSECHGVGTDSCCLVLDARRKVGCFARIFEMISQVPSSASDHFSTPRGLDSSVSQTLGSKVPEGHSPDPSDSLFM